ncbi:EAL domain-containing protein [Ferrimonas lipolytica]|uniref:EAL domain-containing protein n=1 Tax=Ferrimonas lipolytica TaxID=2724191 RepID=A0A6H1UGE3_9GAMM|nr:EAL domain-containing protein [Ferrimonas lipolytica]QIZ77670.1 EAL domain-containing protein [Ferrimonas lipolytica]
MHLFSENNLIRGVRLLPVFVLVVFLTALIFTGLGASKRKLDELEQELSFNLLAEQKRLVKLKVDMTFRQLELAQSKSLVAVRSSIRDRVYKAHTIATGIHNANPNITKVELTQRINSALRGLRFHQGQSYFFMFTMDGINLLAPAHPHLEGTNMLEFRDNKDIPSIKNHIELIRQSELGEAYYQWSYTKPNETKESEKLGFGKYFAPLDAYIGTGEYLSDVRNEVQQDLLELLYFDNHADQDSTFVLNHSGEFLAHSDDSLIGTVADTFREEISFSSDFSRNSKYFIAYQLASSKQPNEFESHIAYVRHFSQWNWVIAASFSDSKLWQQVADELAIAQQKHYSTLFQVFGMCFFIGLIAILPCLVLASALQSRLGKYRAQIIQDLEEIDRHKHQLKHQAEHDALTGLVNRYRTRTEIQTALDHAAPKAQSIALVRIEVDNFKKINDSYGDDIADKLLQHIAITLKNNLKDATTIGRFDNDVFIACIPVNSHKSKIRQQLKQVLEICNRSTTIYGHHLHSKLSVGVALSPNDGDGVDELLSNADLLLSGVKEHGNSQICFFDDELTKQFQEQLLLKQEMQSALDKGEFTVHFQPQISASNGNISAVEALCRWYNPRVGFVQPDIFIDIAEKNGKIHQIGELILSQACKQIACINRHLAEPLMLSVNISPVQLLQDNFVSRTAELVQQSGMPNHQITLELTENVLIADLSTVRTKLEQLKALKFHISLDDFGTGYSSLRYINSLPFDEIKIDRCFITNMMDDQHCMNVTKIVMAMGKFNNLLVVAEGVETIEQQQQLTMMGCDLLQGFRFAKPMTYKELVTAYFQQHVS